MRSVIRTTGVVAVLFICSGCGLFAKYGVQEEPKKIAPTKTAASTSESSSTYPDQNAFVKVEVNPTFTHKEAPVYPPLAVRAKLEGTVIVKILVGKDGLPKDAVVIKASGTEAGFEQASIEAAMKCRFSPALQKGKPIAMWVTFPFKFALSR